MNAFLLISICLLWRSVLFAENPTTLAESAKRAVAGMPRGCIVTGEWRNGEVYYGISGPDQLTHIPAERVVFEIGSVSKVFTGLLLAQAVLERKLTLTSTLRQALDTELNFADENVAKITLAQLATHTSGLPRLPNNADFSTADPYSTYDTKKLVDWIANIKLEKAGPYNQNYSNVGVAILGMAIERALGDSWANLVHDRITGPLGMHDTMPIPTTEMRQRLAPPFDGKATAHEWTFQVFAPAGGLRSTAADLMALGHALTHPDTSPLREAIQLAVQPLMKDIGCCFFLGDDLIMHGGGTGGYRTLFQARPKEDQVRIVLINNASMDPAIVTQAMDRELFKADEGTKLTEVELTPYIGVFQLSEKSKFTFVNREGELWGKLTGQPFLPYVHEKHDVFFNRKVAARIIFGRNSNGAISEVTLDQYNQKQLAARMIEPAPRYLFRTKHDLEGFVGVYDLLPPDKVLKIVLNDGTLYAQITGQSFLPLFETKPGHFEYDIVPAEIDFSYNDSGGVDGLHLTQNGRRLPAPKINK